MIRNKKEKKTDSIPVHFPDDESQLPDEIGLEGVEDNPFSVETGETSASGGVDEALSGEGQPGNEAHDEARDQQAGTSIVTEGQDEASGVEPTASADQDPSPSSGAKTTAGPMLAELIATRAELRRVETERNDLLERLARRQADFENYRKRVERERAETYQRMVGDVVSKLLPVMDNMRRALQAESILEKNESAEFRHFLRGVELIYKQLNDALHELGVEPVPAVGQPFDPHVHEAVATEHSDEYEPDTVTQELLRGYRLGEKLLRPAMVKVSTRQ